MSLNWDLTAIEDRLGTKEYDALITSPFNKDELHPVTNALIWASMVVHLDGITESTAEEFYKRLALVQAYDGPFLAGGSIYITRQDVLDHIGLKTNVKSLRRSG
jgi:hypothetical protein